MSVSALKLKLQDSAIFNYEVLLKNEDAETAADLILEGTYGESDFMKRDTIDRFLDFIYFKVQTGNYDIISMAYPSRRMNDRLLEGKIIEMLNERLYPEIVLRLLKFFTRNIHEPDSNLYIANLIESRPIIKSVFDTYVLFKKDIFVIDIERRTRNVKMIQQFPSRSENKLSSPLDAAARLKYILEFFLIKYDIKEIYTKEIISLAG